jgi:hypothetical protein
MGLSGTTIFSCPIVQTYSLPSTVSEFPCIPECVLCVRLLKAISRPWNTHQCKWNCKIRNISGDTRNSRCQFLKLFSCIRDMHTCISKNISKFSLSLAIGYVSHHRHAYMWFLKKWFPASPRYKPRHADTCQALDTCRNTQLLVLANIQSYSVSSR